MYENLTNENQSYMNLTRNQENSQASAKQTAKSQADTICRIRASFKRPNCKKAFVINYMVKELIKKKKSHQLTALCYRNRMEEKFSEFEMYLGFRSQIFPDKDLSLRLNKKRNNNGCC